MVKEPNLVFGEYIEALVPFGRSWMERNLEWKSPL